MEQENGPEPTQGVIFAATGANYVELALRAARTVREACPGLEIDLYADAAPTEPGLFDQVHILRDPWRRSKIDAMLSSRFERTLYIDSDVFVVADIRDVFEVLDRFDIAMAHDVERNGAGCHAFWRRELPNAFPQFNGGVIAYRRTPEVIAFMERWRRAVREENLPKDQPSLRELIWESDLRVATLPEEYNLMHFHAMSVWWTTRAAPRIIHSPQLHQHFSMNNPKISTLEQLLGPVLATKLPLLIAADRGLARMAGREAREPSERELQERRRKLAGAKAREALRRLRLRLRQARRMLPR